MKNKLIQGASRREFLKGLGSVAAFSILPSGLWGSSPNSRLQVAQAGIGGRGKLNLQSVARLANVDIVGICDVDKSILDNTAAAYSKAAAFRDYRKMLEKLGDKIDAVVVSTPDHMHAPISLAAMELDKHVYCEKPLAHNVKENRKLAEVAESRKLVTQMGIQISSSLTQRMAIHYIQSGLIGKVSQVHVWSHKKWGLDESSLPKRNDPIPATLDWNLWLGVAKERPYLDDYYHPGNWRRMMDFGTGTLGDMGVHIFHTPYKALELKAPKWVKTNTRDPNGISHPRKMVVNYAFHPTSYTTDELNWTWYDGDAAPPKEFDGFTLPEGEELPNQGCLFIGEKGSLLLPHIAAPKTYPKELIRSVPKPKMKPEDHHEEWVNACLGKGQTKAPFSYGGPLCEALQLGVIGARYPGKQLKWNADKLRITNQRKANQYLGREYRSF